MLRLHKDASDAVYVRFAYRNMQVNAVYARFSYINMIRKYTLSDRTCKVVALMLKL